MSSCEFISNICNNFAANKLSAVFACHTGCLLVVQPCLVGWQLMLLLGGVSATAACCRLLRKLIAVSVCCAWRCCKCSFSGALNGRLTTLYIPSLCIYIHVHIYAVVGLLGCLDKSQTNMFQVGNKNESKRIKWNRKHIKQIKEFSQNAHNNNNKLETTKIKRP